jgi:hypothetical protein
MRAAPYVCLARLKLCFWCCASVVPKSGVLHIVARMSRTYLAAMLWLLMLVASVSCLQSAA